MRLYIVALMLATFLFGVPAGADETASPAVIVTASPGGTFYVYGNGLAPLLTKYLGRTFTAVATQGSIQNIVLLEQHKATLGLVTMGLALEAWSGTGWAKGTEHRSIRAIFPMYDSPFQFAAPKRLKLVSLEEFTGKRIGDGPKSGAGAQYMPGIFNTLSMEATLRSGAWEDNMGQVSSGEIDGLAAFAGIPMEGLAELDAQVPLDYLQPSPDQIVRVRQDFPEISPSLVPAGTYPSLPRIIILSAFMFLPWSTTTCRTSLSIKSSKRSSSIIRNWSRRTPPRRKPLRPMSTAARFCRFTRERYAAIARSGSRCQTTRRRTASGDGAGGFLVPVAALTGSRPNLARSSSHP